MSNQADKWAQADKFKDKARELGADESEKAFEDKLRKIAKQKPKTVKRGGKQ